MKMFSTKHCLLIATISLVAAGLPLAGIAQVEPPSDESSTPPQSSQRLFVSDKLVLNVYAEPDQSSARVATIQTGDIVEELERTGNLVRVRLEDGREGWVGASYLTSDEPAATRLRELERQQKSETRGSDKASSDKEFTEEIARLKKENLALQGQVKKLQSTVIAPVAPPVIEAQVIPTNSPEIVSEEKQLARPALSGGVWLGWLIAVVIAGALGFAGGYQTLARRIRRKFGGLQIY